MATSLIDHLRQVEAQALAEIPALTALDALEAFRVRILGKKGALSEVLRGLGQATAEERPKIGAVANEIKAKVEGALELKKSTLETAALSAQLEAERIDVTAPARLAHRGSIHPITQTIDKIVGALKRIGFEVTMGPEVETEALNFDSMNIPSDHPAREMQDTFFMGPGVVLRTQTSPVQARAMRSKKWPLRILCPGAVFRCDSDATHSPMFHQIEGLWVDRHVTMADLKGTLLFFAREVFGPQTEIRMRPSFFPFVEPGCEVDVTCFKCKGKKETTCSICKGTGWLEILGAGMVHPDVFRKSGYDPAEVTGFAFGLGVERIAMLLHQLPDLRLLHRGDVRFLGQF